MESLDFKKSEAMMSSFLLLLFATSMPQPSINSIRNTTRKVKLLNIFNVKKA
jgi:hypothetical protein